ncbi:phosphate/phosphite/phosphonate ABC transporter substrate-binding protein [Paludibaculum fermentans]|uniref:PhnD/SsuA/transferrin family substrate-binding protein n=1 Tax=Paludibaculum fermentans TaxID=1473598 RepID=A0A7S7NTQ8_PALFE|nr:PhnD/SsuA/transferrin family substrate-binding protein [Paludibaculum fermentans]QOY89607.1 PhnD/SsuA/transferrin family substrate-binding protein [Paludibaculum fermentans]
MSKPDYRTDSAGGWIERLSRRRAISLALGANPTFSGVLALSQDGVPVRLALSESVVGDVNLNDARAAMKVWISLITKELNVLIDPKLFSTTQEIYDRMHHGDLDAVALNILEYRQIADLLDSTQIVAAGGPAGLEQYLILVKKGGGFRQLSDLKGKRFCTLKSPRMCLAADWLATMLEEGHRGPADQFFSSMSVDAKFSRVVLPVFFGQSDACLTSKRGFETMCELNPQVARDLRVIASSPQMVLSFYIFRKNYQGLNRQKVIKAISGLRNTTAGQQLATLFQFDELTLRDAGCLTSALAILDAADRVRAQRGSAARKG